MLLLPMYNSLLSHIGYGLQIMTCNQADILCATTPYQIKILIQTESNNKMNIPDSVMATGLQWYWVSQSLLGKW